MPSYTEQVVSVPVTSAGDEADVVVIGQPPDCVPANATPFVKWSWWCRDSANAPKRLPGELIIGLVPHDFISAASFAAATDVWPLYEDDGASSGGEAWAMDDGDGGRGVEVLRDGQEHGGLPRWRNLFFSVEGTALASGDRGRLNLAVEWRW